MNAIPVGGKIVPVTEEVEVALKELMRCSERVGHQGAAEQTLAATRYQLSVLRDNQQQILHYQLLPAIGRMVESYAAHLAKVDVDLDGLIQQLGDAVGKAAARWANEQKREVV